MTSALDTVEDPLITPLLALLKDAINSDLGAEAPSSDGDGDAVVAEPAVATTQPYPAPIEMAGETALPQLSCYRIRSRGRRRSIAYVDRTVTLQFTYVSAATAREQLDERWPLLERVWVALESALLAGRHPMHAGGDDVLGVLGIIDVPVEAMQKREFYAPGGNFAYPAFAAEVDVVVQTAPGADTSHLYPALSFQSDLYIGGVTSAPPDVSALSYTPIGAALRDGLIDEDDLLDAL